MKMVSESQIKILTEEYLEGSVYFVVGIKIRSGNRIEVYLDGDQRVNVDVCIGLNRFIESKLDRNTEDYDLTVSSCGADKPLVLPRQYLKITGGMMEVVDSEGKVLTGKLLRAGESDFDMEINTSPGRKKSKEKEAMTTIVTFKYTEIKSAKEIITFNK